MNAPDADSPIDSRLEAEIIAAVEAGEAELTSLFSPHW